MKAVNPDPVRSGSDKDGKGEAAPGAPSSSKSRGEPQKRGSARAGIRLWPLLIVIGMTLVILVNGLFIYIAVKGADEVVPSYNTEER